MVTTSSRLNMFWLEWFHPFNFFLSQNLPNPFNPETVLRFELPWDDHIVLKILNSLGQEIRTLVDAKYAAGFHSVRWDGKESNGKYSLKWNLFVSAASEYSSQVRKMILLR